MTSRYPHLIRISTSGEAPPEQDPEEGEFESPIDTTIYYGRGDCQDIGEAVVYRQDAPKLDSDAVIFLEDERIIFAVRSGMRVQVIFDPNMGLEIRDAVVERVVLMDGTLRVNFL